MEENTIIEQKPIKFPSTEELIGKIFNKWTVLNVDKNKKYLLECRCECGNLRAISKRSLIKEFSKSCGKCKVRENLNGKIFGKLTVIKEDENKKSHVICKCSCGKTKSISRDSLKRGSSVSCGGCIDFKSLIGTKIERWTIIKQDENDIRLFICSCECGKTTKSINKHSLVKGETKSCGCIKKEYHEQLVGKKFGKLLVLSLADKQGRNIYYNCRCECGKEKPIAKSYLIKTISTIRSCGECDVRLTDYENRTLFLKKRLYKRHKASSPYRGLEFNLTFENYDKLISSPCFYCKQEYCHIEEDIMKIPKSKQIIKLTSATVKYNGIDRLDSSKGYVDGNVVSCCYDCNTAKMDLSLSKFMEWIKRLSANVPELEQKIKNNEFLNYQHPAVDYQDDIYDITG